MGFMILGVFGIFLLVLGLGMALGALLLMLLPAGVVFGFMLHMLWKMGDDAAGGAACLVMDLYGFWFVAAPIVWGYDKLHKAVFPWPGTVPFGLGHGLAFILHGAMVLLAVWIVTYVIERAWRKKRGLLPNQREKAGRRA